MLNSHRVWLKFKYQDRNPRYEPTAKRNRQAASATIRNKALSTHSSLGGTILGWVNKRRYVLSNTSTALSIEIRV